MKSLAFYIKESYDTYRLNSVKVVYNIKSNKDFIIEAPNTFQESDIQQYLDDRLLQDLPSSNKYADKFFGKNSDNIMDAYFEYDSFEHLPKENNISTSNIDIKWDPKYNKSNNDSELDIFKFNNLKYIIFFDRFDILNGNDDNIGSVLEEIFKATVSNDANKYPIEISLDTKNIEYSK